MIGNLPASLLPREIETPGEGQIRALFVSAGPPSCRCRTAPRSNVLGQLELCVSLDLYINETNRHADYILPTTTFYEREDLPIALMGFFTTPFVQFTEAVADPPGDCRQEWAIVDDLSPDGRGALQRSAVAPSGQAGRAAAARAVGRPAAPYRPPRRPLRSAPRRAEPEEAARTPARNGAGRTWPPELPDRLRTPGRRIRLAPPEIRAEVERLDRRTATIPPSRCG